MSVEVQTNNSKVVFHSGVIDELVISHLGDQIRERFADAPKTNRKLFSIFMELTQNIFFYSAEKITDSDSEKRIGSVSITEEEEQYTIQCSNLVEQQYAGELEESCATIKGMDKEALRKYKREQRGKPQGERSKGAGIGLIQVAILSENNLQASIVPENEDFSRYSLDIKVEKIVEDQ
ncbi:SiaB family protein kinase [Flexithrix dorotheae]|uniref:SiaB family protein kinase n=1 Tax=Flexithrix dorotheae TaxID=70993 RepID=UPI0003682B29|nr:SiaB family protein kinase [Flexithrix dorotheae]